MIGIGSSSCKVATGASDTSGLPGARTPSRFRRFTEACMEFPHEVATFRTCNAENSAAEGDRLVAGVRTRRPASDTRALHCPPPNALQQCLHALGACIRVSTLRSCTDCIQPRNTRLSIPISVTWTMQHQVLASTLASSVSEDASVSTPDATNFSTEGITKRPQSSTNRTSALIASFWNGRRLLGP
jgi:hypothetical protein